MEVASVTKYTEKQVRECAREICVIINSAGEGKKVYDPIVKKYAIARYMHVAKIPILLR